VDGEYRCKENGLQLGQITALSSNSTDIPGFLLEVISIRDFSIGIELTQEIKVQQKPAIGHPGIFFST